MFREKVYMVGFMGCGKSTAGRKLASALGWDFADLDAKIEHDTGMAIPRIFNELGEAWFRTSEAKALRELEQQRHIVISTGGGAPCHHANMDFMISSGITIYLKLTPEQLRSRLSASGTDRPLIKGLREEELLKFIREKLSQREMYYNRASIVLDGWDPDIQQIENLVREKIGF